MIKFVKNSALQYVSCSSEFLELTGVSEIFGCTNNDMPWGRCSGGICASTDTLTIESGSYKSKEILFTARGWKSFLIRKILVDNQIHGEMSETDEPEIAILNSFSPETGFRVPYKNMLLDILDIYCILWIEMPWNGTQFEDISKVSRQGGNKRLKRLQEKFSVKNKHQLIDRLSQLKIMSAARIIYKHGMITDLPPLVSNCQLDTLLQN